MQVSIMNKNMFFGELLCIILYLVMSSRDPDAFRMRMLDAKSKGKRTSMNPLLLAIPALMDYLSTTISPDIRIQRPLCQHSRLPEPSSPTAKANDFPRSFEKLPSKHSLSFPLSIGR